MRLPDGSVHELGVEREKGIDLRLGLDVVRMARNAERWLKMVSAFPHGPNATSSRGIDRTDWFRMDQAFYEAFLDPRDYRPPRR